jgi:hypothetical protein
MEPKFLTFPVNFNNRKLNFAPKMLDEVEASINRGLGFCTSVIELLGKRTLLVQEGSKISGGFSLKNHNRKEL